jgi:hypothetical protein
MAASPTTDLSFQNFFSAQLTGDLTASSTDIPMDNIPNGSEGFLVIDPDVALSREIIYYTSKTATKVVCPSVADGRGQDDTSATTHVTGATVIMAPVAAYFETLLSLFTTTPQGWTALTGTFSVASGYNKGQKEFVMDTSENQTSVLSPGMRFKASRGTTAPTQCFDAESSSSQYANDTTVSGISFTDDFTIEGWIKLESYAGYIYIASRYNATSGWYMAVNASGQLDVLGFNASSANFRGGRSYQSIPLGRWVHIAASIDMSGTSYALYIDGASVPTENRSGGTNPSALIQAGNLEIGSANAGGFFDGKIADVRIWSAVRTATQIRDNMNQQLVGNESNLVGYWKLNGNFTDSTANANNLTGQGGAVATNVDNPMVDTEYGIITKVTSTQVTVFTGTDHNIPNMTLNTPFYSTQKAPFGFPTAGAKWRLSSLWRTVVGTTSNATYGSFSSNGWALFVPLGAWNVGWQAALYTNSTTEAYWNISSTALTGLTAQTGYDASPFAGRILSPSAAGMESQYYITQPQNLTADATYVMYTLGALTTAQLSGSVGLCEIFAECAYL